LTDPLLKNRLESHCPELVTVVVGPKHVTALQDLLPQYSTISLLSSQRA
jgi:hypothetical protein